MGLQRKGSLFFEKIEEKDNKIKELRKQNKINKRKEKRYFTF